MFNRNKIKNTARSEAIKKGMAESRARGVKFGRKSMISTIDPIVLKQVRDMAYVGKSNAEIVQKTGLSVYIVKKILHGES